MRTQELTNDEQEYFRQMVRECDEQSGWSIARITRELGYAEPGPVYGYMNPEGGGPSRARYRKMVLLHARVCATGKGSEATANSDGTLEALEVLADQLMNNARIADALQARPMTVAKLGAVLGNLQAHLQADAELLMGLVQ